MRYATGLLASALALALGEIPVALAQDADDYVTGKPIGAPTAEEKAEKRAREACKIEICDILATKERQGPDVACEIGWTWREAEIIDALGGNVDWPWGKLICQTALRLERAPLAKAMSEPRYDLNMQTQTIRCALHHKDGSPYVVDISLAPRVTFKNGKATEASVNWGEVTAPSAIYALLYAGTSLDNSTNMLGPEVVRQVNKFTREDCADVEAELPGRRVN